MPQPLSNFRGKIGLISIGNSSDGPSQNRPVLGTAAMNVVAEFSILESFLIGLFVQMLGANPRPAASMYMALASEAARTAALKALADLVLDEKERSILEAILDAYKTAAKHRNKIAHWIWGYSTELPDAVLLRDPTASVVEQVAYREWEHEQENFHERYEAYMEHWRAAMFARRIPSSQPPTPPQPPKVSFDGIYVFTQADFSEASRSIQRVMGLVQMFRHLLSRHPSIRAGEELAKLLAEPEIRAFLDRQSERQKTTQAAQQQRHPQQDSSVQPSELLDLVRRHLLTQIRRRAGL